MNQASFPDANRATLKIRSSLKGSAIQRKNTELHDRIPGKVRTELPFITITTRNNHGIDVEDIIRYNKLKTCRYSLPDKMLGGKSNEAKIADANKSRELAELEPLFEFIHFSPDSFEPFGPGIQIYFSMMKKFIFCSFVICLFAIIPLVLFSRGNMLTREGDKGWYNGKALSVSFGNFGWVLESLPSTSDANDYENVNRILERTLTEDANSIQVRTLGVILALLDLGCILMYLSFCAWLWIWHLPAADVLSRDDNRISLKYMRHKSDSTALGITEAANFNTKTIVFTDLPKRLDAPVPTRLLLHEDREMRRKYRLLKKQQQRRRKIRREVQRRIALRRLKQEHNALLKAGGGAAALLSPQQLTTNEPLPTLSRPSSPSHKQSVQEDNTETGIVINGDSANMMEGGEGVIHSLKRDASSDPSRTASVLLKAKVQSNPSSNLNSLKKNNILFSLRSNKHYVKLWGKTKKSLLDCGESFKELMGCGSKDDCFTKRFRTVKKGDNLKSSTSNGPRGSAISGIPIVDFDWDKADDLLDIHLNSNNNNDDDDEEVLNRLVNLSMNSNSFLAAGLEDDFQSSSTFSSGNDDNDDDDDDDDDDELIMPLDDDKLEDWEITMMTIKEELLNENDVVNSPNKAEMNFTGAQDLQIQLSGESERTELHKPRKGRKKEDMEKNGQQDQTISQLKINSKSKPKKSKDISFNTTVDDLSQNKPVEKKKKKVVKILELDPTNHSLEPPIQSDSNDEHKTDKAMKQQNKKSVAYALPPKVNFSLHSLETHTPQGESAENKEENKNFSSLDSGQRNVNNEKQTPTKKVLSSTKKIFTQMASRFNLNDSGDNDDDEQLMNRTFINFDQSNNEAKNVMISSAKVVAAQRARIRKRHLNLKEQQRRQLGSMMSLVNTPTTTPYINHFDNGFSPSQNQKADFESSMKNADKFTFDAHSSRKISRTTHTSRSNVFTNNFSNSNTNYDISLENNEVDVSIPTARSSRQQLTKKDDTSPSLGTDSPFRKFDTSLSMKSSRKNNKNNISSRESFSSLEASTVPSFASSGVNSEFRGFLKWRNEAIAESNPGIFSDFEDSSSFDEDNPKLKKGKDDDQNNDNKKIERESIISSVLARVPDFEDFWGDYKPGSYSVAVKDLVTQVIHEQKKIERFRIQIESARRKFQKIVKFLEQKNKEDEIFLELEMNNNKSLKKEDSNLNSNSNNINNNNNNKDTETGMMTVSDRRRKWLKSKSAIGVWKRLADALARLRSHNVIDLPRELIQHSSDLNSSSRLSFLHNRNFNNTVNQNASSLSDIRVDQKFDILSTNNINPLNNINVINGYGSKLDDIIDSMSFRPTEIQQWIEMNEKKEDLIKLHLDELVESPFSPLGVSNNLNDLTASNDKKTLMNSNYFMNKNDNNMISGVSANENNNGMCFTSPDSPVFASQHQPIPCVEDELLGGDDVEHIPMIVLPFHGRNGLLLSAVDLAEKTLNLREQAREVARRTIVNEDHVENNSKDDKKQDQKSLMAKSEVKRLLNLVTPWIEADKPFIIRMNQLPGNNQIHVTTTPTAQATNRSSNNLNVPNNNASKDSAKSNLISSDRSNSLSAANNNMKNNGKSTSGSGDNGAPHAIFASIGGALSAKPISPLHDTSVRRTHLIFSEAEILEQHKRRDSEHNRASRITAALHNFNELLRLAEAQVDQPLSGPYMARPNNAEPIVYDNYGNLVKSKRKTWGSMMISRISSVLSINSNNSIRSNNTVRISPAPVAPPDCDVVSIDEEAGSISAHAGEAVRTAFDVYKDYKKDRDFRSTQIGQIYSMFTSNPCDGGVALKEQERLDDLFNSGWTANEDKPPDQHEERFEPQNIVTASIFDLSPDNDNGSLRIPPSPSKQKSVGSWSMPIHPPSKVHSSINNSLSPKDNSSSNKNKKNSPALAAPAMSNTPSDVSLASSPEKTAISSSAVKRQIRFDDEKTDGMKKIRKKDAILLNDPNHQISINDWFGNDKKTTNDIQSDSMSPTSKKLQKNDKNQSDSLSPSNRVSGGNNSLNNSNNSPSLNASKRNDNNLSQFDHPAISRQKRHGSMGGVSIPIHEELEDQFGHVDFKDEADQALGADIDLHHLIDLLDNIVTLVEYSEEFIQSATTSLLSAARNPLSKSGVTQAFVAFEKEEHAKLVIEAYAEIGKYLSSRQPATHRLAGHPVKAKRAPALSDILWENADARKSSRQRWQILMTLVCIVLLFVSGIAEALLVIFLGLDIPNRSLKAVCDSYLAPLGGVATYELAKCWADLVEPLSFEIMECYCGFTTDPDSGLCNSTTWLRVVVSWLTILVTVFINLIFSEVLTKMHFKTQFESKSAFERSLMWKIFATQFVNTCMLSLIMYAAGADGYSVFGVVIGYKDLDRRWFWGMSVGVVETTFLTSLANPVRDFLVGPVWRGISQLRATKRAMSVSDVLSAWSPLTFELADRNAVSIFLICSTLCFSSIIPILPVFLLASFIIRYWLDKYLLLGSEVPVSYSLSNAKLMVKLLPIGAIAHFLIGFWAYSNPLLMPSYDISTGAAVKFVPYLKSRSGSSLLSGSYPVVDTLDGFDDNRRLTYETFSYDDTLWNQNVLFNDIDHRQLQTDICDTDQGKLIGYTKVRREKIAEKQSYDPEMDGYRLAGFYDSDGRWWGSQMGQRFKSVTGLIFFLGFLITMATYIILIVYYPHDEQVERLTHLRELAKVKIRDEIQLRLKGSLTNSLLLSRKQTLAANAADEEKEIEALLDVVNPDLVAAFLENATAQYQQEQESVVDSHYNSHNNSYGNHGSNSIRSRTSKLISLRKNNQLPLDLVVPPFMSRTASVAPNSLKHTTPPTSTLNEGQDDFQGGPLTKNGLGISAAVSAYIDEKSDSGRSQLVKIDDGKILENDDPVHKNKGGGGSTPGKVSTRSMGELLQRAETMILHRLALMVTRKAHTIKPNVNNNSYHNMEKISNNTEEKKASSIFPFNISFASAFRKTQQQNIEPSDLSKSIEGLNKRNITFNEDNIESVNTIGLNSSGNNDSKLLTNTIIQNFKLTSLMKIKFIPDTETLFDLGLLTGASSSNLVSGAARVEQEYHLKEQARKVNLELNPLEMIYFYLIDRRDKLGLFSDLCPKRQAKLRGEHERKSGASLLSTHRNSQQKNVQNSIQIKQKSFKLKLGSKKSSSIFQNDNSRNYEEDIFDLNDENKFSNHNGVYLHSSTPVSPILTDEGKDAEDFATLKRKFKDPIKLLNLQNLLIDDDFEDDDDELDNPTTRKSSTKRQSNFAISSRASKASQSTSMMTGRLSVSVSREIKATEKAEKVGAWPGEKFSRYRTSTLSQMRIDKDTAEFIKFLPDKQAWALHFSSTIDPFVRIIKQRAHQIHGLHYKAGNDGRMSISERQLKDFIEKTVRIRTYKQILHLLGIKFVELKKLIRAGELLESQRGGIKIWSDKLSQKISKTMKKSCVCHKDDSSKQYNQNTENQWEDTNYVYPLNHPIYKVSDRDMRDLIFANP